MSTQHDTGALFYITDISQSSFAENAPEHDDETDPKVLRTTVDDGKQELSQQCILGFEIPKLQSPKECHLFVASSSDDREQVLKIVEELENQFAIKCLFASRDFQPGKEYRLMIRDGIDTSLKVLLIFTPNFVESPFCQLEAELAYIMSIERKNDCVIPVLLENCEVPATLKPRNYIDATQPGMDIRALTIKIMEALVRIGKLLFTNQILKYTGYYSPSTLKYAKTFLCHTLCTDCPGYFFNFSPTLKGFIGLLFYACY